jgi:hypothetical protein
MTRNYNGNSGNPMKAHRVPGGVYKEKLWKTLQMFNIY